MINQGHRHDIINTAKRKKSSTISFRIDSNYEQKLRLEAEQKRVSLNTLVNQIFGEHVELHHYKDLVQLL